MRKMLLLAATLGACALIPASASADGHDWGLGHVASSLGVKIIMHDAPKVVQYRYHPRRHLRPQTWYRHFNHRAPTWRWNHHAPTWRWNYHAPTWRWHKPSRPGPWHFDRPGGDHQRWAHGPGRHGGPALRHHAPRGRSFGGDRHHDRGRPH
jgi:hypothetical protein